MSGRRQWVVVRATGNGSLDEDVGSFETRDLAVAEIARSRGLFSIWLEEDGKLVAGTWAELLGGGDSR